MSLLAKKLISLDSLNFQAAFIRIEGTLRSVSPLQSSDSAVANLQTLTSTESALTNTAELTCAESALAENKNLKLSGINTCKKIGGRTPVFGRPSLPFPSPGEYDIPPPQASRSRRSDQDRRPERPTEARHLSGPAAARRAVSSREAECGPNTD